MSLHIELAGAVDEAFGQRLARPAEQKQDALVIALDNGVTLTVRYAAPDAYSLRWSYGDAEAGIDTAPLHRELATFPNHLHHANGALRPDPVTGPEHAPTDNVVRLVQALLDDPTFGILDKG